MGKAIETEVAQLQKRLEKLAQERQVAQTSCFLSDQQMHAKVREIDGERKKIEGRLDEIKQSATRAKERREEEKRKKVEAERPGAIAKMVEMFDELKAEREELVSEAM